jgi:hypothetical protein
LGLRRFLRKLAYLIKFNFMQCSVSHEDDGIRDESLVCQKKFSKGEIYREKLKFSQYVAKTKFFRCAIQDKEEKACRKKKKRNQKMRPITRNISFF